MPAECILESMPNCMPNSLREAYEYYKILVCMTNLGRGGGCAWLAYSCSHWLSFQSESAVPFWLSFVKVRNLTNKLKRTITL